MIIEPGARISELVAAFPSADAWWEEIARIGTPLVADLGDGRVEVTFLHRAAGDQDPEGRVYIDGTSLTDHHAEQLTVMQREPDTDILWWRGIVRDDWRSSYSIVPVGRDVVADLDGPGSGADAEGRRRRWLGLIEYARADPFARVRMGEDPKQSVAEMPNAPEQAGRDEAPTGTTESLTWTSQSLGNERSVWIHTTPGSADPRPLVILLDGKTWAVDLPTLGAIDSAVARGELEPCVVVAIDSIDFRVRSVELPCNAGFWTAVVEELLPRVSGIASFLEDPARTVVAGQSYGGLAALFAALERPERFGVVSSQSGSFWWPDFMTRTNGVEDEPETPGNAIADRIRTAGSSERAGISGLRVDMDAGRLEGAMVPHGRAVADALTEAGATVSFTVFEGGHDRACWRGGLVESLIRLLPGAAASV